MDHPGDRSARRRRSGSRIPSPQWRHLAWISLLLILLGSCGKDPRRPGGNSAPAPRDLSQQRLHPRGELRLTSAGREPRVRLRYRLTPGQRSGFRTRVSVQHVAAGRTLSLTALLDWERMVKRVLSGWADVEVLVRRVRLVRPSSIREDVVRRLMAMRLDVWVDALGRAREKAPPAASGLAASLSGQLLPTLTAPLPRDALGEGATWERYEPLRLVLPKIRIPVHLGARTRYSLHLIRKGRSRRYALISSTISLTLGAASPQGSSSATSRVTGAGRGTGELKLDLEHGKVTSARGEVSLELSLRERHRTHTLKQVTRTSTRAIKLRPRPWPSPPSPPTRPSPPSRPGGHLPPPAIPPAAAPG